MPNNLSAKGFRDAIGSFVPGPALLIFGSYASLFSSVRISNADWEFSATKLGVGFGVVYALVISRITVSGENDPRQVKLIRTTQRWTYALGASLVACYVIYGSLGLIEKQSVREVINLPWYLLFAFAMFSLCNTLTFASLVTINDSKLFFWLCLAVVAACIFIFGFWILRQKLC